MSCTKGLSNNDVPYIVHESEMARLERIIKRQFILIIIAICFLVGTNAYWIWYESQFEEVVTTTTTTQDVTQDVKSKDGDAVINDGVHINGEDTTKDSDNND